MARGIDDWEPGVFDSKSPGVTFELFSTVRSSCQTLCARKRPVVVKPSSPTSRRTRCQYAMDHKAPLPADNRLHDEHLHKVEASGTILSNSRSRARSSRRW